LQTVEYGIVPVHINIDERTEKMREFVIMTDSDTEIPYTFAEQHNVPVFLMPYTLNGEESLFDLGKTTDYAGFYQALRDGADAATSTRSTYDIQCFYEEILKEGKDILYVCFSSQLSSHYDLAHLAKDAALENYPEAKIEIVDTLGIAMGAGLLVYHAVRLKEEGKSMEEIIAWLIENRMRSLHYFSVDSLTQLRKGGRVSAVTATLGTMLDLKPILTLNREGKIVAFDKVKGRKKVVKYLADMVEKNYVDDDICKELIVVMHADNEAQAKSLQEAIAGKAKFKNIWFMDVGPVIGSHCGPGVMAVLMMGKEREL